MSTWLIHSGRSKLDGAPVGSGRYPLGSGKEPWQMLSEKQKNKFIKEYGSLDKYKKQADRLAKKNEKLVNNTESKRLSMKNYELRGARYETKSKSPLAYMIPGKRLYNEWRSSENYEKAARVDRNIAKDAYTIERNTQKIDAINAKIDDLDSKAISYGKEYIEQLLAG